MMRAPTPYDCRAEPTSDVLQVTAADDASRDRRNSSFVSEAFARWYVCPSSGERTTRVIGGC